MALSTLLMHELCKRMKPGARIASMGYPDILAPEKEVEAILGERFSSLKYREDSADIQKWHKGEEYQPTHGVPDAHSFFELLGAKLDVFDVARHRGCEIVCDLNYVLGNHSEVDSAHENCDFVIDVGTLEHCFNIAQAALNMAGFLKQGGIILHENPYNWGNHGFYNINPTWYVDFYGQPGFELLDLQIIARNCGNDGTNIGEVPRTKRFRYMETEANMIAIAERIEVLPIEFVVQHKYKKLIPAAPAAGERAKEIVNV